MKTGVNICVPSRPYCNCKKGLNFINEECEQYGNLSGYINLFYEKTDWNF